MAWAYRFLATWRNRAPSLLPSYLAKFCTAFLACTLSVAPTHGKLAAGATPHLRIHQHSGCAHDLRQRAEQQSSRAISPPRLRGEHPSHDASLLALHRDAKGATAETLTVSAHSGCGAPSGATPGGGLPSLVQLTPSSAASSPTCPLSSTRVGPGSPSGVSILPGGVAGRVAAEGRRGQMQTAGLFREKDERTSNVVPRRLTENVYQRRQHNCPTRSKPLVRYVELRRLTQIQQIIPRQKNFYMLMQLDRQNSRQRHDGSSCRLSSQLSARRIAARVFVQQRNLVRRPRLLCLIFDSTNYFPHVRS